MHSCEKLKRREARADPKYARAFVAEGRVRLKRLKTKIFLGPCVGPSKARTHPMFQPITIHSH